MSTKKSNKPTLPSPFNSILPDSLGIGSKDHLLLRLDFYSESVVMQDFNGHEGSFRMVSARDITHALASEISFSSGILPENALWWTNTRSGPAVAIWVEPGIRRLALQTEAAKPPVRYDVPLPGLIFICQSARPPHVFAATKRPTGPKAKVYKAPLTNVHDDGSSCSGSHQYPEDPGAIPDSFFRSFFSRDLVGYLSKRYPNDITRLWKALHGQDKFPLSDLVHHGTVKDLMEMRL